MAVLLTLLLLGLASAMPERQKRQASDSDIFIQPSVVDPGFFPPSIEPSNVSPDIDYTPSLIIDPYPPYTTDDYYSSTNPPNTQCSQVLQPASFPFDVSSRDLCHVNDWEYYPNRANWTVTVRLPSTLYGISIDYSTDIENCCDYLTLGAGRPDSYSFYGSRIGSRNFSTFGGEDIIVRFTSDSSVVRTGFNLTFTELQEPYYPETTTPYVYTTTSPYVYTTTTQQVDTRCSAGRRIYVYDLPYTFTTQDCTDDPDSYPNNARWNVTFVLLATALPTNRIAVDYLVNTEYCCDSLYLENFRVRGSNQSGTEEFDLSYGYDGPEFNVSFRSDYSVTGRGFTVTLRQPGAPDLGSALERLRGTVETLRSLLDNVANILNQLYDLSLNLPPPVNVLNTFAVKK